MADPAGVDSTFNPSYVGVRPEIAGRVPTTAARILDLGAADGALGAFLLDGRPDRTVVGVEIDQEMAATASERLTRVHVEDLEHLDWAAIGADGPFDCIVAADVLEHLHDPQMVLRCAAECLAPGGTVVVSVPNIRHVSALWSIFVRGTFPRRSRGLFDGTHLRWFTPGDCASLCGEAGLTVTDIGFNHRLLDEPGGRVNETISNAQWIDHVRGVRQLLGYQTIVTAIAPARHAPA